MFGLIHDSIRQITVRTYGEEFWRLCMQRAGFESGKENIVNHHYPDEDTYAIVNAISALAKITREDVWEMYGKFFVEYNMNNGWEEMLRCMSPNLKGFLNNLDSLHYFIDHVVYKANLRGPSFRCEETSEDTIVLHYFTGRSGLYPIVKGIISEVARVVFNIEIGMTVAGRTQRSVQLAMGERVEEHVTFIIKLQGASAPNSSNRQPSGHEAVSIKVPQPIYGKTAVDGTAEIDGAWKLRVNQFDFAALLPYHFIIDRECRLIQCGDALSKHVTLDLLQPKTPIIRIFEIYRPQIPFDFENILNFINGVFVLQARSSPLQVRQQQRSSGNSTGEDSATVTNDTVHAQHLKLKGQMLLLDSGDKIIYICSPYVTSVPDLLQYGLRLSSIPAHDATRDLVLLNQQRLNDVEDNLQLEANNDQLEAMARDLEAEKGKTDALLREVLPPSVAVQLMNGLSVDAREYPESTVMFSDVPAFHSIVPKCNPTEVVVMLNDLFVKFDRLITLQNVYKVETIGDSYMTVAGVPEFVENHCEKICHVALGMIWEARTVLDPIDHQPLRIRCGIHSGNIVTGVVGQKMPRYCLFGDTVNTSARMESHSPAGRIHCTNDTVIAAQKTGRFDFLSRGRIMIKGKGEMETFFLLKSCKKSMWEIIQQKRDENKHSIDGFTELFDGIEDEVDHVLPNLVSKTCTIL